MTNAPSQMIAIALWSFLFVTLVVFGLFLFTAQQIPHYQEVARREIQTSGALSNTSISKIEKQLNHGTTATHTQDTDPQGTPAQKQAEQNANQDKVTINRAVQNSDGSWRKESYAEYARDQTKQAYGTKIHYFISYPRFSAGSVHMLRKDGLNSATTMVRGALSDIDMPVTASSEYGGNPVSLSASTGTQWGGLSAGLGGSATNYAVISHNQGIFMRMNVLVDQDSKIRFDVNNSKLNVNSNDNDNMNKRQMSLYDSDGDLLSSPSVNLDVVLKANKQYTLVVKYFNDSTDNISITDQSSTIMFFNPDMSQPTNRTVTFGSFGYSIINMDGTPATVKGNLIANGRQAQTGTASNIANGSTTISGALDRKLANGENAGSIARKLGVGHKVTLSYDWSIAGGNKSGSFYPQFYGTPWGVFGDAGQQISASNTSGHVSTTVAIDSTWLGQTADTIMFRTDYLSGDLTIYNVKLEDSDSQTNFTNDTATLDDGNPNIIQNPTGTNASDQSRPTIDNQSSSVANASTQYNSDGIQLTYARDGSDEWYYAITEYSPNNVPNMPSIQAGHTYTATVYAKGTVPTARFRAEGGSGGNLGDTVKINNDNWTKVTYTFTVTSNSSLFWLRVNGADSSGNISGWGNNIFSRGQTLQLRDFKLEDSATATP